MGVNGFPENLLGGAVLLPTGTTSVGREVS